MLWDLKLTNGPRGTRGPCGNFQRVELDFSTLLGVY